MILYKLFLLSCVIFIFIFRGAECKACCAKRDKLFNANQPNTSLLIQSFYKFFEMDGEDHAFPLVLSNMYQKLFIKEVIENWIQYIGSSSLTNVQKHREIVSKLVTFIKSKYLNTNKSFFVCLPLKQFGSVGEYIQCEYDGNRTLGQVGFEVDCPKWFNKKQYWFTVVSGCDHSYCCQHRDLILNKDNSNNFLIAQSALDVIQNGYSLRLANKLKTYFTSTIKTKWLITLGKQQSNVKKHEEIFKDTVELVTRYMSENKSSILCIPLMYAPGNYSGTLGSYLECEAEELRKSDKNDSIPSYSLLCEDYFPFTPAWALPPKPCPKPVVAKTIKYCCENRDRLLNESYPLESELIKANYESIYRLNNRNYPYYWGIIERGLWVEMITTSWVPIISNRKLYSAEKHEMIYNESIKLLGKMGFNISYIVCIQLTHVGNLGNYFTCVQDKAKLSSNFNLVCESWFSESQNWIAATNPCPEKKYCCADRQYLLNQTSPGSSLLIKGFENAFTANKPLVWRKSLRTRWQTMMTNNWIPIIQNSALQIDDKFVKIYDFAIALIEKFPANKSVVSCTILQNFGHFSDFLRCTNDEDLRKEPKYPILCKSFFDTEKDWMSKGHACPPKPVVTTTTAKPVCCNVTTKLLSANLTLPKSSCAKYQTYTCASNRTGTCLEFKLKKNGTLIRECNTTSTEIQQETECIEKKPYYKNEEITQITCVNDNDEEKVKVAETKQFVCCQDSNLTITEVNAALTKPTGFCTAQLNYTCTSRASPEPCIELITTENKELDYCAPTASNVHSFALNCSNGKFYYGLAEIKSLKCSAQPIVVTTQKPTTKFPCCNTTAAAIQKVLDKGSLTDPTNFCQSQLQYTCTGLHNGACMEINDGASNCNRTGKTVTETLSCINGTVQQSNKAVTKISCSSEEPAPNTTTIKTTTKAFVCCNTTVGSITKTRPTSPNVILPDNKCIRVLNFTCPSGKQPTFFYLNGARPARAGLQSLCVDGKVVDENSKTITQYLC